MDFLDKSIINYTENHTAQPSGLLNKIERETYVQVLQPRMISGHLQGRILSMFSNMIQPKHILEVGTYTGYSALCMAEGLSQGGKLITIDINSELENRVRKYISESEYEHMIDYQIGDAAQLIPKIEHDLDLVFIDADKENYLNYYDLVIDKMKAGSFIIADNVLWSGKVLEKAKRNDKETLALQKFNKTMHEDDRVENLLLPVRDGLTILRVK